LPGADCEIDTDRPATTTVAERAAPVLAATENDAEPLPEPLVADTVIQLGTPLTCQPHPDVVVMVKLPLEPVWVAETVVGVTANVQDVPV
jgi:hypothetical protein